MLFWGGLAETGGSVFIDLSFAHSSLIVRSDILSCASSLTILKAQTEFFSVGVWIKFRAFDLERHSGNLVNDNLFRTFAALNTRWNAINESNKCLRKRSQSLNSSSRLWIY